MCGIETERCWYTLAVSVCCVQGSVTYQLPSAGLTWSSVFRQLEANKDRLGIIDYSVSQTTLDQVRERECVWISLCCGP